jgi:hypothetical protein
VTSSGGPPTHPPEGIALEAGNPRHHQRLHRRGARAQGIRVVDAVAACERRHQERQHLVPDVRAAGGPAQIEEPIDQSLQAQVEGQGGRQEHACVGHELRPAERE